MNLLLVEREELADDGTICLRDRRALHLLGVLKVHPGQELRSGILGEGRARAEVLSLRGSSVTLRLTPEARDAHAVFPMRLILALPRPKAIRRVIQNASCMGVTELELVNSWRVSRSYFSSPVLTPDRLRQEAILGAEQGARTRIPEIRVHRFLMPFLDSLGAPDGELRLLTHPAAAHRLEVSCFASSSTGVMLAVGPEGGWIEREIESFRQLAFIPFSLGGWILRSEVAVAGAIAQIDLLRRMTGGGG